MYCPSGFRTYPLFFEEACYEQTTYDAFGWLSSGSAAHGACQHDRLHPGLVDEHLARGETVFVDFFAPWCSTCRAQDRVVEELRGANSAYDSAMTFIRVDWDTYGTGELAQRLQIPRRSTLVVLRGDEELGRIVAGTSQGDIQALMDLGLS